MTSGIGPRKHLEDIGIPVVYDLSSVGSELVLFLNITQLLADLTTDRLITDGSYQRSCRMGSPSQGVSVRLGGIANHQRRARISKILVLRLGHTGKPNTTSLIIRTIHISERRWYTAVCQIFRT